MLVSCTTSSIAMGMLDREPLDAARLAGPEEVPALLPGPCAPESRFQAMSPAPSHLGSAH